MPAKVASSALAVPYSRIRELAELAMGMEGVLKLYFGESNIPTPDYIKRAAQKAMADGYTYYTENAGLPSLRNSLARYYAELHGGNEQRWVFLEPQYRTRTAVALIGKLLHSRLAHGHE